MKVNCPSGAREQPPKRSRVDGSVLHPTEPLSTAHDDHRRGLDPTGTIERQQQGTNNPGEDWTGAG
jgi:hypothetical protein